jgi:hypothetical protein
MGPAWIGLAWTGLGVNGFGADAEELEAAAGFPLKYLVTLPSADAEPEIPGDENPLDLGGAETEMGVC